MKHIVVAIITGFIFFLMVHIYNLDGVYHGGEAGKIVEDIQSFENKKNSFVEDTSDKDALKALKDKAGNIGKFKVSKVYRSKCASCHGVNGDGIVGPKLYGQSESYVYSKLMDYRSGRLESAVMKGILLSIDDIGLKELSNEIGQFKSAK